MNCRKCNKEIPEGSAFCNHCGAKQDLKPSQKGRRRANGEGTVYKWSNGKWCAEKTFGYEPVRNDIGEVIKHQRIFDRKRGFKTKAEAIAYLPFLTDPRKKELKSTAITLKELYDKWYPTWKAGEKTLEGYRSGFKVFRPVWYLPMEDQDIDDLQECLDEYETKNNTDGKRTRQVAKTCLNLVYKYGIPRNFVPANLSGEPNLAQFLIVKGGSSIHKEGLSMDELEKIRNAIGKIPYAEYIFCSCYLSFRPSALLSLDVMDYNKKEKAIKGGIKTDAGIDRIVTISPKIQPYIDELVKNRISGPLFYNKKTGKALSLKEYRSIFYNIIDNLGIDNPVNENGAHRVTPHSCRHTFATLMKNIDAPTKDKLALIGHTDEKMLQYYQDVNFSDLRKITDQL